MNPRSLNGVIYGGQGPEDLDSRLSNIGCSLYPGVICSPLDRSRNVPSRLTEDYMLNYKYIKEEITVVDPAPETIITGGDGTSTSSSPVKSKPDTALECTCSLCEDPFYSRKQLSSRIENEVPDEVPTSETEVIQKRVKEDDTDGKLFVCSFCDKSFRYKVRFLTHLQTHLNETVFSCLFCYKSFTRESCFDVHILKHIRKKTFTCTSCNETFSDRCQLYIHKRSQFNCFSQCMKIVKILVKKNFCYTCDINLASCMHFANKVKSQTDGSNDIKSVKIVVKKNGCYECPVNKKECDHKYVLCS